MNNVYMEIDRSRLELAPLAHREHDFDLGQIVEPRPAKRVLHELRRVARHIREARQAQAAVVMIMGAHVLRSGVQRYLIDMMERGLITCLALNGAGLIHDYELALIGATTENVARYIKDGRFGMWRETSRINDIVTRAASQGQGLGEAVGRVIEEERFPHRQISLLAAAWRLRLPLTVHVHLGCDITHQHPNCDGAAYGETSYRDFLRLAEALRSLEKGVVMNFGSAVMGPEVYLKALSMARNLARQESKSITRFTTLVCDLHRLIGNTAREAPRHSPQYYYRPWKTMLVRTVAEGGNSYYVRANHAQSIPQLWTALTY